MRRKRINSRWAPSVLPQFSTRKTPSRSPPAVRTLEGMNDKGYVNSAARIGATLRTVLAGFRQGGEHAIPVLIAEQDDGEPEAVLLPYGLFQQMLQDLEDREDQGIAKLAAERIAQAPAPGEGLDNEALARLVAAGQDRADDEPPAAGGSGLGEH
jgi:hypothetical protein